MKPNNTTTTTTNTSNNLNNIHLASNKYLDNLSKMFKQFYTNEQLADVTLYCKDGKIKAHKLILASISKYFRQLFLDNDLNTDNKHLILIMYGFKYEHLNNLIELIYKGNTNISPESIQIINQLIKDLEINCINLIQDNDNNNYGRDTRFKGLKRVAVDYREDDDRLQEENSINNSTNMNNNKKLCESNNQSLQNLNDQTNQNDNSNNDEDEYQIVTAQEYLTPEQEQLPTPSSSIADDTSLSTPKLSAWAKKQRKFKCELCPSSFKRASHLTRHQLVHTGERPYACNQCDKAFSRHDKLKHHIRKTHELSPFAEMIGSTAIYPQIHHHHQQLQLQQQHKYQQQQQHQEEQPKHQQQQQQQGQQQKSQQQRQQTRPESMEVEEAPVVKFEMPPHVTSETETLDTTNDNTPLVNSSANISSTSSTSLTENTLPKRGRGRPRKYPICTKPLIKRGRGRPRLNPVSTVNNGENYDITNLPYGDLEYLTMPLQQPQPHHQPTPIPLPLPPPPLPSTTNEESMESDTSVIIEPYVEIKTDLNEKDEQNVSTISTNSNSNLKVKTIKLINEENKNLLDPASPQSVLCTFENKIAKIGECTISVANH